jgi:hypothetical protein
MGDVLNICRVLVRKPERKRQFRRPRPKCKENIRMDVADKGWEV